MMLFTSHIDHLLAAFHHNELSEAQRNRVSSHLVSCEQCRAAHAAVQAASEAVKLPLLTAPQSLWNRVEAVIAQDAGSASRNGHSPSRINQRRRWAAVCAIAGMCLVCVVA